MGDRLLLSGHSMGPFGAAFVLLAGEGGNVKKNATITRTSGWPDGKQLRSREKSSFNTLSTVPIVSLRPWEKGLHRSRR